MIDRVKPIKPLSVMQTVVAELAGLGLSDAQIAGQLAISIPMVREHAQRAADKIPGDLQRKHRIIAWARGASLDVLCGASLRFKVSRTARWQAAHGPKAGSAPHTGDVSGEGPEP